MSIYKTVKPFEELNEGDQAAARYAWETGFLDPFVLEHQARLFSILAHFAGLPTDIKIRPEDKELISHANSMKPLVIEIARQFGKTSVTILVIFGLCIHNKNSTYYYCAPTEGDADEILNEVVPHILASCPIELRPIRTRRRDKSEFVFPNGSKVLIGGAWNKGDGMRGRASYGTVLDEVGYVHTDVLVNLIASVIKPTLLTTDGFCVLLTTPPANLQHSYYQLADSARQDGRFLRQTIMDNTAYTSDPERFKALRESVMADDPSGGAWDREYMCCPRADAGKLIIPESTFNKVIIGTTDRPSYYPYLHRYISFDHGTVDLAACLFGYYDYPNGKLIIEKELLFPSLSNLTTQKYAQRIMEVRHEIWKDLPIEGRCTIDATGNQLRIDFNNFFTDITFMAPLKSVLLDDEKGREGMVDKIKRAMDNSEIIIHPSCKTLIETLQTAEWKISTSGKREFARQGKIGHADCLAALIYMYQSVYKHVDPLRGRYNVPDYNNHFVVTRIEPQDNHRALANAIGANKKHNIHNKYNKLMKNRYF